MSLHRLFEMVYILMDRKKITAKELAERFEVSTRTIYRDLDVLSMAGIPVYTSKGREGGIEILESYVLDRSTLSEAEQGQILMALQTISAVGTPTGIENKRVLSKLSSLFHKGQESYIEVDFSRWSDCDCVEDDRAKFGKIQHALINKYVLAFRYHGSAREPSTRRAKPIKLVFKHSTWYLQAFCIERQDYRSFKLTRMTDVAITEESYFGEEFNPPALQFSVDKHEDVELLFVKDVAYLVYDEFHADLVDVQEDGRLRVRAHMPVGDWLLSYILSFGPSVEVIQPESLRVSVSEAIRKMYEKYF